jgi:hypothetical protein
LAEGATIGVKAELGFGPADADPADDEGWTWSPMRYAGEADGADRLVGSVRPETAGTHAVAVRISTDGGATWVMADRDGIGYDPSAALAVEALPPADQEAPPAPDGAAASVVSDTAVTLVWEPVDATDLYRYEVWRTDEPDGESVRIGAAGEPSFTDGTVRSGGSYTYVVTAQDTSYNRSADSNAVAAAAASREVALTFTVTVPGDTPPADTIYIAGDFQGWDPGATAMERVDDATWTITLPFAEGAAIQYKYTRGSWDAVEKDSGCAEIPNREASATYGTDGTQQQADTVGKWRDVDNCP